MGNSDASFLELVEKISGGIKHNKSSLKLSHHLWDFIFL
jgi:hypothetical protein